MTTDVFLSDSNELFIQREHVASKESAMLHRHVSAVPQNGRFLLCFVASSVKVHNHHLLFLSK